MNKCDLHQSHRADYSEATKELTPFLPCILLLFLSAFVTNDFDEHPQEYEGSYSTAGVEIYIIVSVFEISHELSGSVVGKHWHEPSIDSLPEIVESLEVLFLLYAFDYTQDDEH